MKKIVTNIIFCLLTTIAYGQYVIQQSDVIFENGEIKECLTNSGNWGTGDIIVPAILGGETVKKITYRAFTDKGITKVDLPNTIEYIGDRAFAMNDIVSFTIPSSVIYLGSDLFAAMNTLDTVSFEPNSNIRIISKNAFYRGSCMGCLLPVFFPTNNTSGFTNYKDIDGNTYNSGELIPSLNSTYIINLPSYTLKDSDVEFENGEIKSCSAWYSDIIIPEKINNETVISIGESAFHNNSLSKIVFPNTIKHIGSYAFNENVLRTIELPEQLEEINERAFEKNRLQTVVIPANTRSIGKHAFMDNYITSLVLPSGITSIGAAAFNSNLIVEINNSPSNGIILGRNPDGNIIDSVIVSYGGIKDTIDFIPDQISIIAEYAFYSAYKRKSIKKVFIPKGITSIKTSAFFGNSQLSNVTFESNSQLTFFGSRVFDGTKIYSLYLPVPIIPNGFFDFVGWFEMYQPVNNIITMPLYSMGKGPFYAKFASIDTISYHNVKDGQNINPISYTEYDSIWFTDLNDTLGWIFKGWYSDSEMKYPIENIPIYSSGNLDVYAKWIPDGDTIFSSTNFSIISHSPSCYGLKDGSITVISKFLDADVYVTEKDTSIIVLTEEPKIIENFEAGSYHLMVSVDSIERNFFVEIPEISEMNISAIVKGNTISFNIEGGKAPYNIFIGNEIHTTETGRLTLNHLKSGTYSATITDKNFCTNETILNFDIERFNIYPNPVENGILYLTLPSSLDGKHCELNILTIDGKILIKKEEIINNMIGIDVSVLDPNIYILKVISSEYTNTTQFFIK